MESEEFPFKSKAWGVVPYPDRPGHYHTGYEGEWRDGHWDRVKLIGTPKANMKIGINVLIRGAFRIGGYARGRSAANFYGHFRGEEKVRYELGMEGTAALWTLVQDGTFTIDDGYIVGTFTIAKQGQSIFLQPHVPN